MAWTAPVDFVAGAQLNAEQLNLIQDNLRALKAPPSQQILRSNGGSYTTASTTPVKVDSANLSITLQTAGGAVLVWFSGSVALSTTGYVYFDVMIDNVVGYANNLGFKGLVGQRINTGGTHDLASFMALLPNIAAGTHTFDLLWYVTGGTATLYSNTGTGNTDLPVIFGAREIS